MNFTVEQRDRAAIFRPQEPRLDSLLVPELKAEFLILAQPDVEKLIVDLSDVEYVDSAGLSALLLARRQQVSHDGDVRLVGVRDEVRSLLELTQLNRVFPIYETVQAALDAPQLSTIHVPGDGMDSTTSALSSGMKAAAVGAGAAAMLGAIAMTDAESDLLLALGDDEIDEDPDDDDEFFDDDDDEELLDDEVEKPEKPEEDADKEKETELDEDDIELEDDIDFDDDEDDDDDDEDIL